MNKTVQQFKTGYVFKVLGENFFLSQVNNTETIASIEANNDAYCLQNRKGKFPLIFDDRCNSLCGTILCIQASNVIYPKAEHTLLALLSISA